MNNDYIEFYGSNGISPVNQNISDLELHFRRRQKLYRQCGIPTITFEGATMLEVGPGGGHNALAPLHWGVKHIELLEPNNVGIDTIKRLFGERGIDVDRYHIVNSRIEDYETDKQFDIVVAEGFLGYVPNAKDICKKLGALCRSGGVVVITCSDDICIFPELIKRLICQAVVSNKETLTEKVNKLIPIFEPQLKTLRGVSRPTKDWIEDNIFNPAFSNGCSFSLGDAIESFEGFDVLGASPSIFTDYSWYKDVWFDEKKEYMDQFDRKRMALVMAGLPECTLNKNDCSKLVEIFSEIKRLENDFEKTGDRTIIMKLSKYMESNKDRVLLMDERLINVYEESCDALKRLELGFEPDLLEYPNLFKAFGRGLQYISFLKVN